jgi:hypothetical protein
MCGLMLESILESASEFVSVAEEARFLQRCRLFACGCGLYPIPYYPAAARAMTRMRRWSSSRCKSLGGAACRAVGLGSHHARLGAALWHTLPYPTPHPCHPLFASDRISLEPITRR